eukprot:c621_g1_i1 orf=313-630(-)
MITRSNLAEQLRDYQLRSQQNWATLTFFSSTANISTRGDAARAGLTGLLFLLLLVVSLLAFYLRHNRLAGFFLLSDLLLLICLKFIRHRKLARRRQRRMLLPLSM